MKFYNEEEAYEYFEAKFEEERLQRAKREALRRSVEERHAQNDSAIDWRSFKPDARPDESAVEYYARKLRERPIRATWVRREDEVDVEEDEDEVEPVNVVDMINAIISDDDAYAAFVEATELREEQRATMWYG